MTPSESSDRESATCRVLRWLTAALAALSLSGCIHDVPVTASATRNIVAELAE